jgi:hypothetical protein
MFYWMRIDGAQFPRGTDLFSERSGQDQGITATNVARPA